MTSWNRDYAPLNERIMIWTEGDALWMNGQRIVCLTLIRRWNIPRMERSLHNFMSV
jgi:hypothetical protein